MKEVNGIQIDEQKAQRLLRRIIMMETNNRAKQQNDLAMVKDIKKKLEEEIECY